MRVEDWFALAVRVFGVITLISGLGTLLDSFLFKLGYFNYLESSPGYYLISGLAHTFVGSFLIRGAPYLVTFAYPMENEGEDSDGEEDSD